MKRLEGQSDLFSFEELSEDELKNENLPNETNVSNGDSVLVPAVFTSVVKSPKHQKILLPLQLEEYPSVTLHKGGGKIVITPNDITAAISLLEIRERLIKISNPIINAQKEILTMQLLPDVSPEDFNHSLRVWSLVGKKIETHPMTRLLERYGLKVNVSLSLAYWVKKAERQLARELTPFLLPDYKDERPLFEKVEAGMILTCKKNFVYDKATIFNKGERYQIVDTARGGAGGDAQENHDQQDGIVKISRTAFTPTAKIMMSEETIFPWTVFNGDMEDFFHYEEKIIYDPAKCMPTTYPDLIQSYQKRLDSMGLELYDHVGQDVVQEAVKRSTCNGKLMRMGKTSESIVCALLWGSSRVAIIAPRNARLFTVKEFQRLGLTDYVVVDELADLQKPAKFYLMTYSWIKKTMDPHRGLRRKGQGYLHRLYTESKAQKTVNHYCPTCKSVLMRLSITKAKSEATGFLLDKTVEWIPDRGYICKNPVCKARVDNGSKIGARWSQTINPDTGKIIRSKPTKLGINSPMWLGPQPDMKSWQAEVKSLEEKLAATKLSTEKNKKELVAAAQTALDIAKVMYDPNQTGEHIGYIDWGLRFHQKCKDHSVQGRYCHQCKQADATWSPAPYRQSIPKLGRDKKVALKDFFTAGVIDEIHNIKSADSDTGKAIRALRTKRRMGLTGTLMPNTPADAFWPLHWVFKGGSAQFPYHQKTGATEFYDRFCEYINIKRGHGLKDSRKMLPYLKNPVAFWELMSSKMVRRNYEDPLVQTSLAKANRYYPTIEFHRVESVMDPKQAAIMVSAINNFESAFTEYSDQVAKAGHLLNQAMVVSQMVYLRIGATCPEYFNVKAAKIGKPAIYDGPLGGGKMSDIQNICATKVAIGEKVVVLSDFVEMRKSLAKMLSEHNPIVFDGNWSDDERTENFEAFLEDPTRKVFIAGTRQIREGTNLSSANTVICCDLLWEPGLQQQAWSRAFTPTSEKRTCNVYVLMAKNSIDEHVYTTFYAKVAAAEQALDRKVINRRAHQVDLRWFVDRVLSDREGLLAYLKEEGDKGIFVDDKSFKAIEERDI